MLKVAISFDYDTPIGYKESFHIQNTSTFADIEGTEEILSIFTKYNITATFGVVAKILNDQTYKEVFRKQIIQINELGHEICSHSYSHQYLPSLQKDALINEIQLSKEVLEDCINKDIKGFIPPFNCPMNFPQKGAFSITELLGLYGRGFSKNSLGKVLSILNNSGYVWSRVSFEPKIKQIQNIFFSQAYNIIQPFKYNSILAIPVHSTGFGEKTQNIIHSNLGKNNIICIYAHPHQTFNQNNDQNSTQLIYMLDKFNDSRKAGLLDYIRMDEIINYI